MADLQGIIQNDWIQTRFHSGNDDKFTIERVQDVEPILSNNKARQNDGTDGYSKSRDLKQIASIPLVVAEQWIKEDGVNWLQLTGQEREKYIRRKLADPDNFYLRTDNRAGL